MVALRGIGFLLGVLSAAMLIAVLLHLWGQKRKFGEALEPGRLGRLDWKAKIVVAGSILGVAVGAALFAASYR
jgi:hypothetical protein